MGYYVYCHTNIINGKRYVGVTSQRPLERWQNGKRYSRHKDFYNDILKYGWESFKHDILFSGLTEDEAKQKEIYLIDKWNLLDNKLGYNKHKGGNIPKLNTKAIEKLREQNKGSKNPFYNHNHTEEAKKLMAKNRPKKSVMCIETGIVYISTREAERQTGAYHGDISKCCKGNMNIAGGLHWKYA